MAQHLETIDFCSTVHLDSWTDPVGEIVGHDPRSEYVERFWLPFLGPSTTWLIRYLAAALEREPEGCDLDITEIARALGLGERVGKNGAFLRSVLRAVDYQMAKFNGPSHLALRRQLPPLSSRLISRLPRGLAAEHHLLHEQPDPVALDALAARGRQLALSLLELGESSEEAERHLFRWRFDPILARRCVRWAASQRAAREMHPASRATKALAGQRQNGGDR